jgi:hypothetical protein
MVRLAQERIRRHKRLAQSDAVRCEKGCFFNFLRQKAKPVVFVSGREDRISADAVPDSPLVPSRRCRVELCPQLIEIEDEIPSAMRHAVAVCAEDGKIRRGVCFSGF